MRDTDKLELWRGRFDDAKRAWSAERARMDKREQLYAGNHTLQPVTDKDCARRGEQKARHVQNIIAENIESEVSTSIPQPKVTARRKQDEEKAALIENMLRNELDRLPFETINDMQERTCPIQGGTFYLAEWDESCVRHGARGETTVRAVHPKQLIPQDGITTGVQDMDWVFLETPATKTEIKRRYGVDVTDETEQEPDIRGAGGVDTAEELVTLCTAYYRGTDGKIGKYSWVGDTQVEDLPDFMARKVHRCSGCGALISGDELRMELPTLDGTKPEEGKKAPGGARQKNVCPYCGSKKVQLEQQEYEEVWQPIVTQHGTVIPGAQLGLGEDGLPEMQPTRIPYYEPDGYPIVMQRNVPVFGRLLGSSDADAIADQQNTLNRLDKKILDRICKAGTRITLPNKANLRMDPEDGEIWYLDNVADRNSIGAYDFKGDLEYELYYRSNVEQQARNILGITESMQGRQDETAQSGIAKQFAAAQSAGRLESKRVCKDAAYADLFRLMFQLRLAYADEPRPVVYQDDRGETVYDSFDRYDFLEYDADADEWWWNDQFLFSTDAAAGLATNRQSMWQELTAAFQSGSFGAPNETETLMLYWSKMEQQHYPGAAETARYFKDKLEREQQALAMQQAAAQQQAVMQQVEQQAQQDAAQDAGAGEMPPRGNVPAEIDVQGTLA